MAPPNDLADALLSAVPDAVLVCAADGTIVRANAAAARLLSSDDPVGRSAFEWLDEAGVRASLHEPFAAYIGEQAVDIHPARTEAGFALVLRLPPAPALRRDVERLALGLTEGIRGPLASIRAAIETLTEYPGMDEVVAAQFTTIIREQAVALSDQLEEATASLAEAIQTERPLEIVQARDFVVRVVDALRKEEIEAEPGESLDLTIRTEWASLEPGLVHLAHRIANASRAPTLRVEIGQAGRLAALDLVWQGPAVTPERLGRWLEEPLDASGRSQESLHDVLERHGGACWIGERDEGEAAVRVLLPSAETTAATV